MKTIKLAGIKSSWIITMPSVLYWFFKKLSKIQSQKESVYLQGSELEVIYYDEGGKRKMRVPCHPLDNELRRWKWPYLRINFGGSVELECPHEVGHGGIHGCDGCCQHVSYDKALKKFLKKIKGRKKNARKNT